MQDNSEKLEKDPEQIISETDGNAIEAKEENIEKASMPSDAPEEKAPEAEEKSEPKEEPKEEEKPALKDTEEKEALASEKKADAPEQAPETSARAQDNVINRKKSEEAKLEALRYAEEYRRKLQIEKEASERSNADEEALRSLREAEEKNKEEALQREKEEAKAHSDKMSKLLSKIGSSSDEKSESAPTPETAPTTENKEPEVIEEPVTAPAVSEEKAPEKVEEKAEETVEEPKADDGEPMVISVDMGISSDVLLIDGVSVEIPGASKEAPVVYASQKTAKTEAVPGAAITEEKSSEQDTAIKAGIVGAAIGAGVIAGSKKAVKDEIKIDDHSHLEADIDITESVRGYVESGKKTVTTQKKVNDANKILGEQEKRLREKEDKKQRKLELERFAKENKAVPQVNSEPETVYEDKEITDDVLMAAGIAVAAAGVKAKKNAKAVVPEYPEYPDPIEPVAVSSANAPDMDRAPELDHDDIAGGHPDLGYPDIPPAVAKGEEARELEGLAKDGMAKSAIAAYEEAVGKKDAKRAAKEMKRDAKEASKKHSKESRANAIDKKQIKKFIKQDREIDLRFISEYHEHLIRDKKMELDSYKMKFNKKTSEKKSKKTERALTAELEALREESKREIKREENDNKRIYIPLLIDYRTARVKKGADREELVMLRERLLALLHERQDLNSRLINLYLGNEDGKFNVYEKRTDAELKARRKAYKKQRKLEREIKSYHISLSHATKLRSLMDAYVMKYGLLASIKVAIKKGSETRKARREFKRELARVKRELKRIEHDIERIKTKAIKEARDRRRARFGMVVGWTVFILLCTAGILGYVFWDDIASAISGLF